MVKTNKGLNSLREAIISEISEVAVGTGKTEATKADTSLEAEVLSKPASNSEGGDGEAKIRMTLGTAEANGSALAEVGTKDASGNLEDRIVHSEINKTSDIEVEYRIKETAYNR